LKLPAGNWIVLDQVESTQTVAAESLLSANPAGVVFAHHQVAGKGRLGREWHSDRGDSLTFSLIFRDYADHPQPYLIGMACALAVAGAVHTQVRWPNDLIVGTRKVGGILTEILPDKDGNRVPVVGIGLNLNQRTFPADLDLIATSLAQEHHREYDALDVAKAILDRMDSLPEPRAWSDLSPVWELFDRTPGKLYKLPNGDYAVALGIGSDGRLLCSVDGESRSVLAAEAHFG
jgi:BirA family biotin operon repressor/biotin-[acetyl-CoA-carboxylase] ligase